jgi:hypothetical protein
MKTQIVGAGALGGINRIPPGWNGRSISGEAHDPWPIEILNA